MWGRRAGVGGRRGRGTDEGVSTAFPVQLQYGNGDRLQLSTAQVSYNVRVRFLFVQCECQVHFTHQYSPWRTRMVGKEMCGGPNKSANWNSGGLKCLI